MLKEALLRGVNDPNSGLSQEARDFNIENNGNKVPPGYKVSHEQPLYTASSNEGKAGLDNSDNMRT
ncbi:hypothetical protein [Flavobacterium sp. ACN6]|uniref:hypothetical protein n=1 Tax=Flavobacterium sp. ACN6 TaxID=1920426 RepID=UPI000BB2EC4F|nr:hypothetical protein [Flavobacterium sp. ACN6]PBJ14605.1 hypothetical protein BSF42_10270 [Flavobacterium sp. ACN6]